MLGYQLFPSPVGTFGLAWTAEGIASLQLPESTEEKTIRRLLRTGPQTPRIDPPQDISQAITLIQRLLRGEHVDLSVIRIDIQTSPFKHRVYELSRHIPPGTTRTYGELALDAGSPGSARAVGQAMATNPLPLIIPCHRVVAADRRLGGFSAPGGLVTKQRLLAIEREATGLFASRPAAHTA